MSRTPDDPGTPGAEASAPSTLNASTYIGDGVYVRFDGYALILTTGHHEPEQADNVIVLEPEVYEGLARFVANLKAARAQRAE